MKIIQITPAPVNPASGAPILRVAHLEYFSAIVVSPLVAWALVEYQFDDDATETHLEPVYLYDCEGLAETRVGRTSHAMNSADDIGTTLVSDRVLRPGEAVAGLSEWTTGCGRAYAHIEIKSDPRIGAWHSEYIDLDSDACLDALRKAKAAAMAKQAEPGQP